MDTASRLRYRAARYFGKRNHKVDLEKPIISFSFDDFPKSAADIGARILEDRDVRGSFYACADFAGKVVNGIPQYDISDLPRLWKAGHEVGCHTASHSPLSKLSAEEANKEFGRNAQFFASLGAARAPTTFAYPFGDVSIASKNYAGRHFSACRGIIAGINTRKTDLNLLKCVSMEPHILSSRSLESWIGETIQKRGWLILLTHDVSVNPSAFGITPDVLEHTVDLALASGATVLPITSTLDLLN